MFKAVMKLFRSLTTLLLGLTTAASVALAAPTGLGAGSAGTGSPFAGGGQPKTVTVQLVSRQTAGIPRATNDIGILLKHEPGWHTYWQFSGDSGFAPSVEWKLPRRWTTEQIGWPTPQKHKLGPITNFVYSGEVLLPFNLDIPWGTDRREGGGKGTFHELWVLQWEPKLVVDIINAGSWGNTLLEAAVRRTLELASRADLPELAKLMDVALLADLAEAIDGLVHTLEERAALTTDTLQLLRTLPELVRVARYGDVRGTDTAMVLTLVEGIVPRVAVGLHAACSGLDGESSAPLREPLRAAHESIRLVGQEELTAMWRQALRRLLPEESGVHALIRGSAARLLFDDEVLSSDEVARQMGFALSPASEPEQAADWLSSFLGESAMVLLHDDALWSMVDVWLAELPAEQFTTILPVLRRTFTAFSAPERRQLAERARRAPAEGGSAHASAHASVWNEERAALPLPFLRNILGLAGSGPDDNGRGAHG